MSKSQSKIPSRARSQGAITPRRPRTRRILSSASPAQSEARLSTVVERFVKSDKLVLSSMKRRSVLPDDTAIEAPERASWWKRLEGSPRDVLEALDTNTMTENLMLEQYEFEVEKNDKQSQSVQQSQSSESVASIVVPQRRLFNQKKQTRGKFGDMMGSRKSLEKTNIEDKSIEYAPKNLFNKGPRNKPVFPAALLNSTNKTINKTDEPETNKQMYPNLFGQAGGRRKNMFTDFGLSDSEEDSEVHHKVSGFKKYNNKKISLGTRNRRMLSLTPSMTTEIDIDDWNLLPSSTMIGTHSRMSNKDMEQAQDENQDDTLTEDNASLNRTKQTHESMIQSDENDKTLTNENILDGNNSQNMSMETTGSKKVKKTHNNSKTKLNVSGKDKTSQHKSINQASNISNAENLESVDITQQQNNANHQITENVLSLKDKMTEIHRPSVDKEESRQKFTSYKTQKNIGEETNTTSTTAQEIRNDSKTPNNTKQNENLCEKDKAQKLYHSAQGTITNCGSTELDKINTEEEIETNAEANKIDKDDLGETEKDNNKKVDTSLEEHGQNQAEEAIKSDQDENIDGSDEEQEVSEIEKEHSEEEQEVSEVEIEESEEEQDVSEILLLSLDNDLMEEDDVVEETPNNSTQDTTDRNRNKVVSKVKIPEPVLQNMTNDNESFRPIGRSTTFRKSKSVYDTIHLRHTLAPVQESTLGSDGSRNSSTTGSEWDSHRTTRKTIRQTLGKEYTTRKSLRALVMEQSAKRQTELSNKNTFKFYKTTNKTVTKNINENNASKINKTKNKTVIKNGNCKNESTINKKTMIEHAYNDNASKINKTQNKTVLEDIDDQDILFRGTSNRKSRNLSPNLRSPVHGNSTHHVSDPLISEHQASYHKSLHDIKEPKVSQETLTNLEATVNIPIFENDSRPEISFNASYGQGMTASGHVDLEITDVEMLDKENTYIFKKKNSRRVTSVRSKSINNSNQEVLDYEASEQVISGLEDQKISNHDESVQNETSESENEDEFEQSERELESEPEYSQQDIEPDSEEESQEGAQEIEEQEQSQEEIVSDQESQDIEQEPESEDQSEKQPDHNSSEESLNEQESEHDISREPEYENSDQEEFISALNSKYKTPERRGGSRIVFDSNMSSDEIDFEGTNNVITANTGREAENGIENSGRELSRASEKRVSEPIHDVSLATKKAMLIIQMEKVAQQAMERKQKYRDQLEKKLQQTDMNYNSQYIGLRLPQHCIRRPPLLRKPKSKPKPTGLHAETLPKTFAEDLMYKPPKRFKPASAAWITKRLYNFLETKLEPKYDYRARVRAEDLVRTMFNFTKLVRRRVVAPPQAVDELKEEMARLRIVKTHFEFYNFLDEFLPTEIILKVKPDMVNKIPLPRNGIFSDILPSRVVVE